MVVIVTALIVVIVGSILSFYTNFIFVDEDVVMIWYSAFLVVIVALLSEILYVLWQIKCAINDGEGCK